MTSCSLDVEGEDVVGELVGGRLGGGDRELEGARGDGHGPQFLTVTPGRSRA